MGIYDREYYRDEEPSGLGFGGVSTRSVVIQIIAVNVVVYIMCSISEDMSKLLMLQGESIYKPWMLWQIVTYGFVHDLNGGAHIVLNMISLWFFGTEIETVFGKRTFLKLYFSAVILGALVWLGRQYLMGPEDPEAMRAMFSNRALLGASGGVLAAVMLFCLKFPQRMVMLMFVIPVPAWVLGGILILGNIGMTRSQVGDGIAFDVHLVGIAVAFAFYRFGHLLGGPDLPRSSRRRSRGGSGGWFSWLKPRPKLRIHDPDLGDAAEELESDIDYEELDRRGDEILQKWHQKGEESLSEEERKLLEAYSRRMQQKHR